jgi:hypothetical protein
MAEIPFDSRDLDLNKPIKRVSYPESSKQDEIQNDQVGSPDFKAIANGRSQRNQAGEDIIPSKADIFIPEHFSTLPIDFKEPPPYFLNAQEWEIYVRRKEKIENRIEEELLGTF